MSERAPRRLLREIRRTRLLPVLAVYLSASVIAIEVVDIFVERFGLPDWFFPGAIVLLVLGLPVAIATALVQAEPRSHADARSGVGAEAERPARRQPDSGSPSAAPNPTKRAAKRWLTWRKASLAGVAAFAGWGLIAAGFLALRAVGIGPTGSLVAAGVIEMREPVLVADFVNRTPDQYLGDAVTEAFRVDFGRSEVVAQVEPDRVRSALERMNRAADAPLDPELARELAVREGIKAIVTGDITAAGTGYVLSARLLATDGGEILRAARSEATDDGEVIAAIDQLSRQLRERIGESLRNIRRGEPLERVTTASLDALDRYSRAIRVSSIEDDNDREIALLEEAVALDSTFAMAYRRLGIALRNRGDSEPGDSALARAYRHRDRLTEEERYLTTAAYFSYPGNDTPRAMRAYEALLELNPNHWIALNNLALLYAGEGETERAISLLRQAVEHNPRVSRGVYRNLLNHLMRVGELEEAESILDAMHERFPPVLFDRYLEGGFAFAQWEFEAADSAWRAVADSAELEDIRRGALISLAASAAARGRLSDADRLLRESTDVSDDPAGHRPVDRLSYALFRLLVGQPDEALRLTDAVIAEHELSPDDRESVLLAAMMYAQAGRAEDARGVVARYDAVSDTPFDEGEGPQAEWVDAAIAVAEGRPEEGIPVFREMTEQCRNCRILLSGAFDRIGEPDSAVAHARLFFDPAPDPLNGNVFVPWLGEAIWRVAEAEEAAGANALAASHYGKFAELWNDADPEFQPRVAEARRRIKVLTESTPDS